jgi:hypothetical protein
MEISEDRVEQDEWVCEACWVAVCPEEAEWVHGRTVREVGVLEEGVREGVVTGYPIGERATRSGCRRWPDAVLVVDLSIL